MASLMEHTEHTDKINSMYGDSVKECSRLRNENDTIKTEFDKLKQNYDQVLIENIQLKEDKDKYCQEQNEVLREVDKVKKKVKKKGGGRITLDMKKEEELVYINKLRNKYGEKIECYMVKDNKKFKVYDIPKVMKLLKGCGGD